MWLLALRGSAVADDLGTTFIPLSASLSAAENICLQPSLLLTDMCVMNLGPDLSKTYSSAVLLRARGLNNASVARGFTNGADPSLRPDLTVAATVRTVSAFSEIRATALVNMDMFLCSEPTCNNAVDLTYINASDQNMGPGETLSASQLGFRVGLVPQTLLAVGMPLPEDDSTIVNELVAHLELFPRSVQSVVRAQRAIGPNAQYFDNSRYAGVAVLGTRVVFEAFSDSLLGLPGLGFGAFVMDGTCTGLLYPNSPWFQEYIIAALSPCDGATASQSFVLRGLQAGGSPAGWCTLCDSFTTSIENKVAGCYPTDFPSCGDFTTCFMEGSTYPRVNMTVSGWDLVVYDLTSELACDYAGGQSPYTHQWSTILFEVVAAGRAGTPAGCNYTAGSVTEVGTAGQALTYTASGDINPPDGTFSNYSCPAAGPVGQAAAAQQSGYAALAAGLQEVWVVGGPGVLFSMLGYERATLWSLNSSVTAVEGWAAQLADSAATNAAADFNYVLRVPGWISLFATNVAAAIGAWAGYSGVEDWIIAITTHTSAASLRRRTAGKLLAILLVGLITVLPLLISMLTDLLANSGNHGKHVKTFMQQAFEAPGYGDYRVVAIAQIDITAANSTLPLALGIPFLCALVGIGVAAVLLTEHRRDKKDRLTAHTASQPPGIETVAVMGFDKPVVLSDHPSHLGTWHGVAI